MPENCCGVQVPVESTSGCDDRFLDFLWYFGDAYLCQYTRQSSAVYGCGKLRVWPSVHPPFCHSITIFWFFWPKNLKFGGMVYDFVDEVRTATMFRSKFIPPDWTLYAIISAMAIKSFIITSTKCSAEIRILCAIYQCGLGYFKSFIISLGTGPNSAGS